MRRTLLFLLIIAALILSACAPKPTSPTQETSEVVEQTDKQSESAAVEGAEEPVSTTDDPVVETKDTLVIAIPGTPPGIDPDTQSAPQMWTIGAQLYGQLGMRWHQIPYETTQTVADPNKVPGFWIADSDMGKIEPGIVESCNLEPDGSKVTFVLREGVLSSYGNELTTADVEYGLDRSFDTKAIGYFFAGVGGAKERDQWKTIDKYTMEVIKKDSSLGSLCPLMTHLGAAPAWIMDSVEVKKHATEDDPWAQEWVNEYGSWYGPYYIVDWEAGKQVILEANPNWWGPELSIKKILYQVIPESSNRIALLKAGEVDLIEGISPEEAASLENTPGVRPVAVKSNKQFFVVMDESKPPFNDVKVRQALNLSVDREAIVDSIYKGLAYPYEGVLPVTFPGFKDPEKYKFDLEKAKALLEEAGYPDGFDVELSFAAGSPEEEQIAILWQSALREIGVNITLRKLPTAAISDLVFQKNANFAFWQDAPFLPDPVFGVQLWYASYSTAQFNKFNDPKVDDGIAECANVVDWDERVQCSQELAEYISTIVPLVNITAPYYIYAVSDKVTGANFNFGQSYVVETMTVAP